MSEWGCEGRGDAGQRSGAPKGQCGAKDELQELGDGEVRRTGEGGGADAWWARSELARTGAGDLVVGEGAGMKTWGHSGCLEDRLQSQGNTGEVEVQRPEVCGPGTPGWRSGV